MQKLKNLLKDSWDSFVKLITLFYCFFLGILVPIAAIYYRTRDSQARSYIFFFEREFKQWTLWVERAIQENL